MKKSYNWSLKDIIMIGIVSVIFAVVYLWILYFAIWLKAVLTPFGLSMFAYEIVFGVWFMAATFASYIIRKPMVAVVSEMLAAIIEVLMGNMFGPIVFVSGFIQGAGAEFAFMSTRYKKFNWKSMTLASFYCTVFSFAWGFVRSGFFKISPMILIMMFCVRFLSALTFSTIMCKVLADKLAKAGVLKGYAIDNDEKENLEVYDN